MYSCTPRNAWANPYVLGKPKTFLALGNVPALAPKVEELRAKYRRQMTDKYGGGLADFLVQNREDWWD